MDYNSSVEFVEYFVDKINGWRYISGIARQSLARNSCCYCCCWCRRASMETVKTGTAKIPRAARVLFGSKHRLSILNLEFNKFGFWYICVSYPTWIEASRKVKDTHKKCVSPKNSVQKKNIEEEYYEDISNRGKSLLDDMYRERTTSLSFNQT